MPHLFNDIVVVTEKEIMETGLFKSVEALRKKASRMNRLNDLVYKKVQRAAPGKGVLYDYASLPSDVKSVLPKHLLEQFYGMVESASSYYQFRNLKKKQRDQYTVNAQALIAAIRLKDAREQFRRSLTVPLKGVMQTVVFDVHDFNSVLQEKYGVKHTLPKSVPRFRRLMNEFLKPCEHPFNYACLLSGKIGNSNKKRTKIVSDENKLEG